MVFLGVKSRAQQKTEIVLQDEHLPITPKEFYVANVIDERANRAAIAWILPAGNTASTQRKAFPVDLQGGSLTAIKQFIDHNLPRNTALHPVIISIKKFTTTETALAGGRVEGHISLIMSFYLKSNEYDTLIGGQHLADYNGSAVYNRNTGPPQDIEPTVRHMLGNGLIYLNNWMNQQANNNIKLAKSVKVTFTDFLAKPEGDTIYYSFKRLLTWDDFKSKVASSSYDAQVFPTIGYDEHTEVINGVINIKMIIKVSLPKSACWVKSSSRSDYTLNHEQRHFDIAKIAADHFKQKLKSEVLPLDNYDGQINMDYLDAYREMDDLQRQYDTETRHGSDHSEQQRWNEKIDEELKKVIGH
ncbi:MAG: hypothetical protein JWQ63_2452 [Mucilaginibacter sp.]|nr:hypothetical protein [Mucilaginibacter sp.]